MTQHVPPVDTSEKPGIYGILLIHALALLAFAVGVSPFAVIICVAMFVIRALGITAGFHRYFSHRAYKTSRVMHTILAVMGSMAAQGKLFWWVSHHRDHHKHSDHKFDLHSPVAHSFWFSHIGWLATRRSVRQGKAPVLDFKKYPELRWVDKHYYSILFAQGVVLFLIGYMFADTFNTSGLQVLIWGYFVSMVLSSNTTFAINSICHRFGSRPYNTDDNSRNNFLIGVISLGEGWHNNHHKFSYSAKMGLKWWQIDITWYVLWALSKLKLVWELRRPVTT